MTWGWLGSSWWVSVRFLEWLLACILPITVAAKHVVHRIGSYLAATATNSVTSQIVSADGLFCRVLWCATWHHLLFKTCCSTRRGISKVLPDDSWRSIQHWLVLAMAQNPSRLEHQRADVHWGSECTFSIAQDEPARLARRVSCCTSLLDPTLLMLE